MKINYLPIILAILALMTISINHANKKAKQNDISETESVASIENVESTKESTTLFERMIDDAIYGLSDIIQTSLESTAKKETTTKVTTVPNTIKSEVISEAVKKVEKERPNDPNKYFLTDLGRFRITFYNPGSDNGAWGYATATGVRSEHLATCAVDPNVIPLGSVIVVNGLMLKCVDVGSMVKGNSIDIFFDGSEKEMIAYSNEFGDYANVKLQYLGGGE